MKSYEFTLKQFIFIIYCHLVTNKLIQKKKQKLHNKNLNKRKMIHNFCNFKRNKNHFFVKLITRMLRSE